MDTKIRLFLSYREMFGRVDKEMGTAVFARRDLKMRTAVFVRHVWRDVTIRRFHTFSEAVDRRARARRDHRNSRDRIHSADTTK
jgi:hypothetical protein